MSRIIPFIALWISTVPGYCFQPITGARQTALGLTGTAQADIQAAFINPAAVAFIDGLNVGITCQNYAGISDLNAFAVAVGIPTKSVGTFSFTASRCGTPYFWEQQFQVSYAKRLSPKFSLGMDVINIANLLKDEWNENRDHWTTRAGLYLIPINRLRLGLSVFNPTNTRIARSGDERLPVIMRIGSAYSISKKVTWYSDAEKRTARELRIGNGLEYLATSLLSLRTGFSTAPFRLTYGFGLAMNSLLLDMSAVYQPQPGYTISVSLTYALNNK